VVEDEQQDDQKSLVEQLSPTYSSAISIWTCYQGGPTLHQECENDIPASVQLVVSLRVGHVLGLHGGGGCHWVFSSDSDTVEELR
jgi:hypothetical protein